MRTRLRGGEIRTSDRACAFRAAAKHARAIFRPPFLPSFQSFRAVNVLPRCAGKNRHRPFQPTDRRLSPPRFSSSPRDNSQHGRNRRRDANALLHVVIKGYNLIISFDASRDFDIYIYIKSSIDRKRGKIGRLSDNYCGIWITAFNFNFALNEIFQKSFASRRN